MSRTHVILVSACVLLGGAGLPLAAGQTLTNSFTYQGELQNGASLPTGNYDMQFRLYSVAAGPLGTGQVGSTVCLNNVAVIGGKLSVPLDFGAQFSGDRRWLEVSVRQDTGLDCANAAGFTTLAPRQELTASPYAVFARAANSALTAVTATTATNATQLNGQAAGFYQNAANLTGTLASARLNGTYGNALTLNNAGNQFTGNGSGLTQLSAANLSTGTIPDARLPGNLAKTDATNIFTLANTFTAPTTSFVNIKSSGWIGSDTGPVELRAGDTVALRLLPSFGQPLVLGGAITNAVGANVEGVTIAGGYNNRGLASRTTIAGGDNNEVNGDAGTISGGRTNLIYAPSVINSPNAVISGGRLNIAGGDSTTISGGRSNLTRASFSTISGGELNSVDGGAWGTIGGGGPSDPANAFATRNLVSDNFGTIGGGGGNWAGNNTSPATDAQFATVGGGANNKATGAFSSIAGGSANEASGFVAAIAGGDFNIASGERSAVGGGNGNRALGRLSSVGGGASNTASLEGATVPGGVRNVAGGLYSFAAGADAIVRNPTQANNNAGDFGTFIWSDSQGNPFESTGPNQFLIRAQGNVGINTNAPAHTLDVNGNIRSRGADFLLTGRGGGLLGSVGRALVDGGSGQVGPAGLVINFSNDFGQVVVDSSLFVNESLAVSGGISKGFGTFKIDHPLDPKNKYLYHSFVESPDMMNIYNGVVTTDDGGYAVVTLPDYFDALNRDFRYQLTVIDTSEDDFILSKVYREIGETAPNEFMIKTSSPSIKVSWQVTGVREDALAQQRRVQVEVEKEPGMKGKYLYPEAFGVKQDRAYPVMTESAKP